MASYNTPIITTQGQSLLKATIANNDTITFTKIVFSSDDYSQSTDSNVTSLTALSSLDLTATARAFVDVNGNLKIRGVATNQNTTSAFYIKTYGLYVKNSAGTEMLFAVATTQNANFVPAYNNKQTNQVAYTFNLAISSTSNITLSNQSDVDVTQADIASINNAVKSNASSLSSSMNSVSNSLSSSISNNSSAINSLSNTVGNQSYSISSLSSSANTNFQNITSNSYAIASNSANIASNASAISSNANSTSSAISSVSSSNNAVSSSIASTVSVNQSNIANNSSAINSLVSSASSAIANNAQAINQNTSNIQALQNNYSVLNSYTLQYRGVWQGHYWDWASHPDGIYTIDKGQNPLDGFFSGPAKNFSGWGTLRLISTNSGNDRYCVIHDNLNQMFRNHLFVIPATFNGWFQF